MDRVHLYIQGRVQGVFFRAYTEKEADRLGLNGWVRNTFDGSVEVLAEGPREKLEEFIAWCHKGPKMATVTEVKQEWEVATGEFKEFKIKYE